MILEKKMEKARLMLREESAAINRDFIWQLLLALQNKCRPSFAEARIVKESRDMYFEVLEEKFQVLAEKEFLLNFVSGWVADEGVVQGGKEAARDYLESKLKEVPNNQNQRGLQ